MPQDSHPSENENENETSHVIELHQTKHYNHLEEEDSFRSSVGSDASSPVIITHPRVLGRSTGISRIPISDTIETSARDEWLKFVKEHQRERDIEKKEFQRNLPKKILKFVFQQMCTAEFILSVLFLLFFIACYILSDFKEVKIAENELYRWAFLCGAMLWGFFVTKFFVKRIIKLSKRFRFFESYVYYFIYSSHRSLSVLIVASVLFPFWHSFVPYLNNEKVIKYFNTSFVVVIMLCSTNIVRAIGTKLLTGMANKSHFHAQIVNALFNERMLVHLMMPKKRLKEIPKQKKKFSMKELFGDVELRRFHSMSRLVQKRSLAALDQELSTWDEVNSTEKARELAQQVFKNIDRAGKGYITKQDISHFVKPKYINKVFQVFDVDKDGKVVDEEVEDLVIKIYRERNALANGLKDRENMGLVLTKIITFIFWIVMTFISLAIFGVNIINWITPLAAFFVGFSFIFGDSVKEIFSSVILIFVIHPYDVGDRITLDKQTVMVVDSIHLLTTHFHTLEGKYIMLKNSTMASNRIENYQRSRIASHKFELQIAFGTKMELIIQLRHCILKYLESHPKVWKTNLDFWISDLDHNNKISILFWCTTRFTWQEGPTNWTAKTDLLLHIKNRMVELGITYFAPPQCNYISTTPEDKKFLSQLFFAQQ